MKRLNGSKGGIVPLCWIDICTTDFDDCNKETCWLYDSCKYDASHCVVIDRCGDYW